MKTDLNVQSKMVMTEIMKTLSLPCWFMRAINYPAHQIVVMVVWIPHPLYWFACIVFPLQYTFSPAPFVLLLLRGLWEFHVSDLPKLIKTNWPCPVEFTQYNTSYILCRKFKFTTSSYCFLLIKLLYCYMICTLNQFIYVTDEIVIFTCYFSLKFLKKSKNCLIK